MYIILLVALLGVAAGLSVQSPSFLKSTTSLFAEIRDPTAKAEELRFGWDGSTALGGAAVDSTPARMLDQIKAAGETIPPSLELFLANMEMDANGFTFEEFIEEIDAVYEQGGVVWSNGASNWTEEENVGSCKLLSFAAIAELSKDDTLKLWAQYYRDVLATPDSTDHINIRTFMAQGWDGVKFDNGIGLTKKASTDGWDWDSESFIP